MAGDINFIFDAVSCFMFCMKWRFIDWNGIDGVIMESKEFEVLINPFPLLHMTSGVVDFIVTLPYFLKTLLLN